ncbi:MAG: YitT family protein [Bacteroidales bacterium]|nr:YitT family protein [Bacteroidales bacterium]MDD3701155.1 YitT family protein [Bacteroidales bacterium]MDY0368602.1 YitT family protein [Bacteroidales bacterium]
MKKNNALLREVRSYAVITLGLFVMALGWTAFLIPNEILGGGVSGISTLIFWVTGLPVGVSVFAINAVLLVFGLRILGRGFGIKTIYSIVVLSGFYALLQYYIREPFVTDKFLASIVGAGMAGSAMGFIFTLGGSTGGTDIIALIVNKYKNISPGRVILLLDVFIISSSYLVFRSIEPLVYGFVVMGVTSYTIDLIITGNKQSVQLFIFSKHAALIADRIGNELGRGVTFIRGVGWYTKTENDILMIIVRKTEYQQVFRIVKEEDPEAFLSLSMVMGVYGIGFDTIR